MAHRTRTFTPAELEAIGVPDELDCPGYATELHNEQVDSRRWVAVHELVFRHPVDGLAYRVHYERGLTADPWDYDTTVTATVVEERQVTVTKWLPIDEEDQDEPTCGARPRHGTAACHLSPGHAQQDGTPHRARLAIGGEIEFTAAPSV